MAKYVPPSRRQGFLGPRFCKCFGIQSSDRHNPYRSPRLSRKDNEARALRRFVDCCAAGALTCVRDLEECNRFRVQLPGSVQSVLVFVQPIKRLHSQERDNGQEEFGFLELKINSNTPGWLVSCSCDFVAFEVLNGFLLAPWTALCALELETGDPPIRSYRFPRQIHRKLYSPDVDNYPTGMLLTLVSLEHDIAPLPNALLLKIE